MSSWLCVNRSSRWGLGKCATHCTSLSSCSIKKLFLLLNILSTKEEIILVNKTNLADISSVVPTISINDVYNFNSGSIAIAFFEQIFFPKFLPRICFIILLWANTKNFIFKTYILFFVAVNTSSRFKRRKTFVMF